MIKSRDNIIAFGLFLGLLIYLILRAFYVPFLPDEAGTFFFFIQNGKFIPPDVHWDANNHILNSALSYLSYLFFGPNPFALRLPNVLMFGVFFYYLVKIAAEIPSKWLQWTFILSLALAHNFIEFFALDRGYGMSMAFLFGAIYYLMEVLKHRKLVYYFATSGFLLLALLANLTLMYTAILFVFILALSIFYTMDGKRTSPSIKAIGIIIGMSVLPMLAFIRLLLEYKSRGLLYYGTLDGFWDLSVNSLIKLLAGSASILIPIAIIIYFIFILFIFLKKLMDSKHVSFFLKPENLFSILFFGNLSAVFILGYLFDINFPEDRTGLYFLPFFIGSIIFTISSLNKIFSEKRLVISVLPFLFFPIHFIQSSNLSHSKLWIDEGIPTRYYSQIAADSKENENLYTIGGYRMRKIAFAFQNYSNKGQLNQIQSSHYPEYLSDYQIVIKKTAEDWDLYYEELDYDPVSELSLLKRKEKLTYRPLVDGKLTEAQVIQKEYFPLFKGKVDSLSGRSLLINTSFKIKSDAAPLHVWVIAEIKNAQGKKSSYETILLEWNKKHWIEDDNEFKASMFIYDIAEDADRISLYLWNVKKVNYEISDLQYRIRSIIE